MIQKTILFVDQRKGQEARVQGCERARKEARERGAGERGGACQATGETLNEDQEGKIASKAKVAEELKKMEELVSKLSL